MFDMVQTAKSSSRMLALGLVAAVGIMVGAQQAHAYTDFFGEDVNNSEANPIAAFPNALAAQAAFLGGLVGDVGTENFEGFADGTTQPLDLDFGSAGTATLAGGGGAINSVTPGDTNGKGRYATSGSNYFEVAAGGTPTFTVTFSQPVAAFGFFGVDIGDFGGQLSLVVTTTEGELSGDIEHFLGDGGSSGGSVFFFGLVAEIGDALITSVEFLSSSGDGDIFAFDDFTVASPEQIIEVPEPSTVALFGLGLIGLGVGLRRRRRSII